MNNIKIEYVWLDGGNPEDSNKTHKLRSKTRIVGDSDIPDWNYDGSSTNQATTDNSEIILKPQTRIKDPFLGGYNTIVMCDTYTPDGKPHKTNNRHFLQKVVEEKDQKTWWGFEQEYIMFDRSTGKPLGWPEGQDNYPKKQGDYYCGVGANHVKGRKIAQRHMDLCLESGLPITGINAEVMLGQWEYQLGTKSALEGADQMWLSRYILYRIGEEYNVEMNIDPKPYKSVDWNGSGMHVNFSTEDMRDKENIKSGKSIELIEEACEKLSQVHEKHIEIYGHGNEHRLTGANETASYKEFKWGYGQRDASIRVPFGVKNRELGYLEDRRPASNADPYLVVKRLLTTIC